MIKEQITTQPLAPIELLERIAEKTLGIETLTSRKSDHLDFHDLAVWSIEAALRAAYVAGMESATGAAR